MHDDRRAKAANFHHRFVEHNAEPINPAIGMTHLWHSVEGAAAQLDFAKLPKLLSIPRSLNKEWRLRLLSR
jgi:hypothetical protein